MQVNRFLADAAVKMARAIDGGDFERPSSALDAAAVLDVFTGTKKAFYDDVSRRNPTVFSH